MDIEATKELRIKFKQDADACQKLHNNNANKNFNEQKEIFLSNIKFIINVATSQCMELFAKLRHIKRQEQVKIAKLGEDEGYTIANIHLHSMRLEHDV